MAQVTSPIILDSTGQQIHSDLQQIKNVLTTPSAAADITFDNTGTGMQADDVQDAITELKSNLTNYEDYSTSEVVCGKWIDGKTLYKLTLVSQSEVTAGARITFDISSYNIADIVHMEGILIKGGYNRNIPYSYRAETSYSTYPAEVLSMYKSSQGLIIVNSSNQNLGTAYITIKYIKSS